MTRTRGVLLVLLGLIASACASTTFVSTWKSPTARPLELRGAKVVAVVMIRDPASRKAAEDRLASEITARGAQGIPLYTILPEASVTDEAKAREAIEHAGVQGTVVMHPTGAKTEGYVTTQPAYDVFWDGYYAHGWGAPWDGADTAHSTSTVVSVDTRIYSLKQNKLVWAGQSKTTNPSGVDGLIVDLAKATADQLKDLGLIAK
jgi:hypothetical protein